MPQPLHTDASQADTTLTFKTRFGEVQLRADRLIDFPQGLFGFRECTQFGLARLPNVEDTPLLLLQCTTQPAIAFLVADPTLLGLEIAAADKAEAVADAQLSPVDTQFLTILTLYDQGDSYYLTANLKAPVLIDSARRTGVQYILGNQTYSTQHKV